MNRMADSLQRWLYLSTEWLIESGAWVVLLAAGCVAAFVVSLCCGLRV